MKKVVFLLILLSLEVNSFANDQQYIPPIGIPAPSFGINETYRMYDFEPNQNPALVYNDSPSGGKYTHYIDNTAPNATDSGNPFGSIDIPRKTVPSSANGSLPAGSIVEIHGGPYTVGDPYPRYWTWWTGEGSKEYPIFIRGIDNPIHNGLTGIRLCGQYIIIEGINFINSAIIAGGTYIAYYTPGHANNLVVRDCELHGLLGESINALTAYYTQDVVFYNNYIHHNGTVDNTGLDSKDVSGVVVYTGAFKTWILDNEICYNDGDAIIVNGSGGSYDPNVQPEYVFIGGNNLHHDKENAVDLKDSDHVIISQNNIYGYSKTPRAYGADLNVRAIGDTSDATALVLANEGNTSHWLLFNTIHDCYNGITIHDAYCRTQSYIIGNIINNVECFAVLGWESEDVHFMNNIVYNVGAGLVFPTAGGAQTKCSFLICNNIFSNILKGCNWATNFFPNHYINIKDSIALESTTVENNLFYNGGGIKWGNTVYNTLEEFVSANPTEGVNCLESCPLFVDPENGNFNLQESSQVNNMETSDKVHAIYESFLQLYGINLADDIDGVPRTSPTIVLPEPEDTSDSDNSGTDVNTDTGSNDADTVITETPSVPEDNSSPSTPIENTGSSNTTGLVSPPMISPLPMPLADTSTAETNSSNNTSTAEYSTISILYSATSSGLHVDGSKDAKIRTIKVRRIFERFDDIYCPPNKNIKSSDIYE